LLLRALEEESLWPIGSTYPMPFHARLLAAADQNLEALVESGAFRRDLYLRLSVMQVRLPPLRERKGDIPLLVDYFIEKHGGQGSKMECSSEAMDRFLAHDWPGNVRELENAVLRALSLASGPVIEAGDVSLDVRDEPAARPSTTHELLPLLGDLERYAIVRALREAGGDQLAAARSLGIGKSTLHKKLKHYGM
jgi:transcriptional regulator with PAS, ATPase and Fis domain